jgi:hypothetical protein
VPQDNFTVFLSAVTSEFGRARDAVANDLRAAHGLTVRVQSSFRQEAGSDTTLQRDHDYIRDCDAVVCDLLAPHAQMIVQYADGARIGEPTAHLMNQLGQLLRSKINEASYGPNHPIVASMLNNLARLLQAINRLNEAEPLFRKSLAILVRITLTTGHQHPDLETVRSNYTHALYELGGTQSEIGAALSSIWAEVRKPPP